MITTFTVAKILGVSTRRVRALIAAGRIKARQDGRVWIVDTVDLKGVMIRRAGRPSKGYR